MKRRDTFLSVQIQLLQISEDKLTSGAALLGFSAPVVGLDEDRGLQAWVAEDSTNMGWLMCVGPRLGLPRALPD